MAAVEVVFVIVFMVLWVVVVFGSIGGLVLGVVALVSVVQTPTPAFGPWWDNTKTAWLLGIAVSYLIPLGLWVTAIHWYRTGKRGLDQQGMVGRPFWIGPIKPYPPPPMPWYPAPPGPEAGRAWGSPAPPAAEEPGGAGPAGPSSG